MIVTQAYRFALDPTARQVGVLLRHAGAARVAYNWGLAQVKANLSQREAERSYGIADGDLTPSLSWSMHSLRKAWNTAKADVAPWWAECSKEVYATGLDRLATGLRNWQDSRQTSDDTRPPALLSAGARPAAGPWRSAAAADCAGR
ncbi:MULTISPECIES: helix-turn-helix domain-containing protein [Kitasatospora]|uniref:Helix-turn-helix domain-containing protein n=1 Tax=Kitasatospora cathayae TaxID=3004092 RepID=A0ABY7QCQ9_9ACTN|nr:helix-turn-helix domain-containing protein [Kitasatospora sp. HUAS 3-15]WBP90503.1 helix-turn-helix domain-containing protein [Kitasatospora sp. HUAS 3-15]